MRVCIGQSRRSALFDQRPLDECPPFGGQRFGRYSRSGAGTEATFRRQGGRDLKKTRILPFIAVAAFMAVAAPSANAGILVKTANDCATETIENPFTKWGDNNDYVAVPNGNVENGSDDWSLSGSS